MILPGFLAYNFVCGQPVITAPLSVDLRKPMCYIEFAIKLQLWLVR